MIFPISSPIWLQHFCKPWNAVYTPPFWSDIMENQDRAVGMGPPLAWPDRSLMLFLFHIKAVNPKLTSKITCPKSKVIKKFVINKPTISHTDTTHVGGSWVMVFTVVYFVHRQASTSTYLDVFIFSCAQRYLNNNSFALRVKPKLS